MNYYVDKVMLTKTLEQKSCTECLRSEDWGTRARQGHRAVVAEVEKVEARSQSGAGERREERGERREEAEWEVRNAGGQRSRQLGTCSKQAGRAAGSRDGVGASRPTP